MIQPKMAEQQYTIVNFCHQYFSQVIVERFGLFSRFGFMHVVATNLALWVRTIIWESANEWIHHIYREDAKAGLLRGGADGVVASRPSSSDFVLDSPIALGLRSG